MFCRAQYQRGIFTTLIDSPRRNWHLTAIIVKAALGLATEPSGLDIFHQQWRWTVFGIAGGIVQHLDDFETGIEPYEIG